MKRHNPLLGRGYLNLPMSSGTYAPTEENGLPILEASCSLAAEPLLECEDDRKTLERDRGEWLTTRRSAGLLHLLCYLTNFQFR